MKIKNILYCIVSIWLFLACTKGVNHPVPSVATDVTIDINLPSYNSLQSVSGYAYVNGGSKGLIVYRQSLNEFTAYDRHSPEDPAGTCGQPLTPQEDNFLQLEDTCNQAVFSLLDGSPIEGSEFGLRLYRTVWDGNSKVRISN